MKNYTKGGFEFIEIEGRTIVIKGVGKLFYQEGFPISMSVSKFKQMGIEVSILHVADECSKNGWSDDTVYVRLRDNFEDDIDKDNKYDFNLLKQFCYASYEDQREMLFEYLFGCTTNEVRNKTNTKPIELMNQLWN